jgi:retron-type reverse transcriptase
MIGKDKAIEYLDWYFYDDDGNVDKYAIQKYNNLKNYIDICEKCLMKTTHIEAGFQGHNLIIQER